MIADHELQYLANVVAISGCNSLIQLVITTSNLDGLHRAKYVCVCVRAFDARTVLGLARSTQLLGLFVDPDVLLASRPVLPWAMGQKVDKADGNTHRVSILPDQMNQ